MLFGNAAMLNYLPPRLSAYFNSYVHNYSTFLSTAVNLDNFAIGFTAYQPRFVCPTSRSHGCIVIGARNQGSLLYELLPLHWAHAPNLIARLF